jgi:hypothetical protein
MSCVFSMKGSLGLRVLVRDIKTSWNNFWALSRSPSIAQVHARLLLQINVWGWSCRSIFCNVEWSKSLPQRTPSYGKSSQYCSQSRVCHVLWDLGVWGSRGKLASYSSEPWHISCGTEGKEHVIVSRVQLATLEYVTSLLLREDNVFLRASASGKNAMRLVTIAWYKPRGGAVERHAAQRRALGKFIREFSALSFPGAVA